eukprot:TRINITY_DN10966_c0_g1_i1.p1 TRINITY_DN10966_c0_g1~~TRINITY_DN10966_c0_g1_i1.p1  ORF type:complete len:615 (+),score=65.00 TRINITY_DN10966_c0_g1_i1:66-1910(+)
MSTSPASATPSATITQLLDSVQRFVSDYSSLHAENSQLRSRLQELLEIQFKDEHSLNVASTAAPRESTSSQCDESSHARGQVMQDFPSLLQAPYDKRKQNDAFSQHRDAFGIRISSSGLTSSRSLEFSSLSSNGDESIADIAYGDEKCSRRSLQSVTCEPKMEVAKRKGIFATRADMNDVLSDKVHSGQMQQAYKMHGFPQRVARSAYFEYTTLVTIVAYAIWMGVETDLNESDILNESRLVFFVGEHIFCLYFLIELLIRFFAVARKIDCLHDACFMFDFALVVTMVLETWVLPVVYLCTAHGDVGTGLVGDASILRIGKLMRLIRVFRVARIVRMIPEMHIMVKAISAGKRTVTFAFLLLALVIYVFGLSLVQTLRHTPVGSDYFGSMLRAVNSLFILGTFFGGISETFFSRIERESYLALGMVYTFLVITATIIMNMVIGVLCEIISNVAAAEKDAIQIKWIKDNLTHMVQIDRDELGNEVIRHNEFQVMMDNHETIATLRAIDVDINTFAEFVETLFESSAERDVVSVWQVAELCAQLRGCNSATVKDIIEVRRMLSVHFMQIQEALGIETFRRGSRASSLARSSRMLDVRRPRHSSENDRTNRTRRTIH